MTCDGPAHRSMQRRAVSCERVIQGIGRGSAYGHSRVGREMVTAQRIARLKAPSRGNGSRNERNPARRTLNQSMSSHSSRSRLGFEAGRAVFGLWLIAMSLLAAPQLNSWLDRRHPALAVVRLGGAITFAVVACAGLTLVTAAALKALTSLVSAPQSRSTSA